MELRQKTDGAHSYIDIQDTGNDTAGKCTGQSEHEEPSKRGRGRDLDTH